MGWVYIMKIAENTSEVINRTSQREEDFHEGPEEGGGTSL